VCGNASGRGSLGGGGGVVSKLERNSVWGGSSGVAVEEDSSEEGGWGVWSGVGGSVERALRVDLVDLCTQGRSNTPLEVYLYKLCEGKN
jgi:hypothetical protein